MDKIKLLYTVTNKCSRSEDYSSKAYVALFTILGIAAAVASGFGGKTVAELTPLVAILLPGINIGTNLFMLLYSLIALVVIGIAAKKLLGTMFMSSDIDILAAMPFSSAEIAFARVLPTLPLSYLVALAVILPFTLGYCLVSGFNGILIMCSVCAILLIPAGSISIVAIVLTLIMRFFRAARNRDLLIILGVLAGILLAVLFYMLSNSLSSQRGAAQASSVISTLANLVGFSWIMPHAAFCGFAMTHGLLYLLLSVLIVAALVGLLYLTLSKMYLPAALAMINASSKQKSLDSIDMQRATASQSVEKALFKKECVAYFKEANYMSSWLFAPILPLLFFLPNVLGKSLDEGLIGGLKQLGHLDPVVSLLAGVSIALCLSFSAAAFCSTGVSCISREGENFDFMKIIPVSYENQLNAKRKTTMVAFLISSTSYILIGGVAGCILGFGSPLMFISALITNIFCIELISNIQLRTATLNANIHWANAQAAVKNDIAWVIIGIIGYAFFFLVFNLVSSGSLTFNAMIMSNSGSIILYLYIGIAAVVVLLGIAAFVTKKPCLRFAARRVAKLV